jgi:hypothetical protein
MWDMTWEFGGAVWVKKYGHIRDGGEWDATRQGWWYPPIRRAYASFPCSNSPTKPIPRAAWPDWAVAAEKLAGSADKGVGDTLARCFKQLEREAIAATSSLATCCQGAGKKDMLNRFYPYDRDGNGNPDPAAETSTR